MNPKKSPNRRNRQNSIPKEKITWLIEYIRVLADPDIFLADISSLRDELDGYEWDEEIQKYDKWLIEDIKEIIKVNPVIEDDDSQPLEKWWLHLHKIANESYPKELLPDYLQEVYENGS